MVFRTAGAIATLLLGLGGPGGQALAQYYPPPQAYPRPQRVSAAGRCPARRAIRSYRPLPRRSSDADDAPAATPASIEPAAAPPAVRRQAVEPGRAIGARPGYRDERAAATGTVYPRRSRRVPRRLRSRAIRKDVPQQGYPQQGYPQQAVIRSRAIRSRARRQQATATPQGFEPAAAGTRPYYPAAGAGRRQRPGRSAAADADRAPARSGRASRPGQVDPAPTGRARRQHGSFPAEVRPETGPKKELPPQFRRTLVDYRTKEPAGTHHHRYAEHLSLSRARQRARRCATASASAARASLGPAPRR